MIPLLCTAVVILGLLSMARSIRHNRDIDQDRQWLRHYGIEGVGVGEPPMKGWRD